MARYRRAPQRQRTPRQRSQSSEQREQAQKKSLQLFQLSGDISKHLKTSQNEGQETAELDQDALEICRRIRRSTVASKSSLRRTFSLRKAVLIGEIANGDLLSSHDVPACSQHQLVISAPIGIWVTVLDSNMVGSRPRSVRVEGGFQINGGSHWFITVFEAVVFPDLSTT